MTHTNLNTSPFRSDHAPRRASGAQWPRRLAALAAVLLAAAGCSSTGPVYRVTVQGDIPTPALDPMPLTAVVHYPPEFANFVSEQESLQGETWQVAFVNLQQAYLHKILESSFETVIISPDATPPANLIYDVFIVPKVDDFSFLTPAESGTKFFAASMRHFIDLYDGNGVNAGAWEINSYGRSRSGFGRPVYELAQEACLNAMRDFATSVAVGMGEEINNRKILDSSDGD